MKSEEIENLDRKIKLARTILATIDRLTSEYARIERASSFVLSQQRGGGGSRYVEIGYCEMTQSADFKIDSTSAAPRDLFDKIRETILAEVQAKIDGQRKDLEAL